MNPQTPSLRAFCLVAVVVLAGCSGATPVSETTDTTATTPTSSEITTAANGTVAVHFINVGQSVSTLIVGPTGETMLVDSGHFQDDGEHVLAYLQAHNIERLDYMIVSHSDADHIGGNAAVIEYYETEADGTGTIYGPGIAAGTQTYGRYLDTIEEHDVTLYENHAGIPSGYISDWHRTSS